MDYVRLPPSWDEVGFPEFQLIIEDACEPEVAERLISSVEVLYKAFENPGTIGKPSEAHDAVLRGATRQLRQFVGRETESLRRRIRDLDGSYLLSAIAALGAMPLVHDNEPTRIPGLYDREVEWLSTLPVDTAGRVPTWDEVINTIGTARRCLTVSYMDLSPDSTVPTMLRMRSAMASDFGTTYVPIARDLTERLTQTAIKQAAVLRGSHLAPFVKETERVFQEHIRRVTDIVMSVLRRHPDVTSKAHIAETLVQTWQVHELVDALRLDKHLTDSACIRDLTARLPGQPAEPIDLRAQPLLALDSSAVLILPRRIACDRHEVLDQAVSRFLRVNGLQGRTYPQLRADMLDTVVAGSLATILPGCQPIVGQIWQIGSNKYERDVVALYDDIAVCVETKAAQMVPSRRASHNDVVELLRRYISHGVHQVTSIADALEAGTAIVNGTPIPRVRRAYRLVASFNSWWGIDLATEALHDEGVLPTLDAAILTYAGSFAAYEKLFERPADFISYLDFRLSYQRRPWITVSDDFEMIGGYFNNASDDWRHRPPGRVSYTVKNSFQQDVTETLRAAYSGQDWRSSWLEQKHFPLIAENLNTLERTRPAGWLQAFSALSRLPTWTQMHIEQAALDRTATTQGGVRAITLENRACTLVTIRDRNEVSRRAWINLARNAAIATPFVAIEQGTNQVLAIRGVDDHDCWIDPVWGETLNQADLADPANAPQLRRTRIQPKRKSRRARQTHKT